LSGLSADDADLVLRRLGAGSVPTAEDRIVARVLREVAAMHEMLANADDSDYRLPAMLYARAKELARE
jgi:hypothetical protein